MTRQHICTGSRLFLILLVVSSVGVMETKAKTGPIHGKVVVCYISTWAVYRPGHGAYSLDNFDPSLCTHVVYAFAGLDPELSAIKSLDPWQDLKEDYGKGGYERLTGMKRTHPHLKVTLAIGGWNEGSKNYSRMVADPVARGKFVKQVTSFIRRYNFDGLDLDWEYPTQRDGNPADRENFVLLCKELREQFQPHNLLLTSAIGAAKNVIDQAYDVRQISRYLDFLHIMCYDYHGSWDRKVGYNAPLTAPQGDALSVQYTIDYLLKLGAPPEKIVMGVPFYGRTFKTPFDGNIDDDTDGTAFQGPYTREDGFLGYNEICQILKNKTSGWTTMWDPETSQVVARSEKDVFNGLVQVVTFDNSRSIANKVRFAMDRNLAGVMVWSIDTDDFLGECEIEEDIYEDYRHLKHSGLRLPTRLHNNYPLLRTINEAMPLAIEEIKNKHHHHDDDHDMHGHGGDHGHRNHDDDADGDHVEDNEIPHGSVEDRKGESNSALRKLQNPFFVAVVWCLLCIVFN
ncbi:probable chitinase 2 [Musca vetustissima]|uniref:probable chitinase 2 n=1 Tax=Musca vetustissima TaxID=27455 RepID=UPI002AB68F08|nr:probable chitinase 2 [Musca vetustissima]